MIAAVLLAPAAFGARAVQPEERDHLATASEDSLQEAAAADDALTGSRLVSIHGLWHNDAAYFQPFSPTDKWFSNSFRVQAGFEPPEGSHWTRSIADAIPALGMNTDRVRWGINFGQEIYTPADIEEPDPIDDDRPFAGYLYGGAVLQRAGGNIFDEFRADIGVIGDPSLGEETQKCVHRLLPDQEIPQGWTNQLETEPTFQTQALRRWRIALAEPERAGGFGVDMLPEAGARLGTVRIDANAAVTIRAGVGLQDHFGPARVHGPIEIGPHDEPDEWSWYVFARAGGEAIAHDLFLDGNVLRDSTRSVAKEEFVGHLSTGLVVRYRAFELGWQTTWETERFEEQRSGHAFGTYTFGWRFDF